MKGPFAIRAARPDEAQAIAATLAEAFAAYESLYTPEAFAATTPNEAVIRSRFSEGAIWVAVLNEKIVGTVSVIPASESLYIRSMAVLPEARGQRIGERLLSEIEHYAVAQGFQQLSLKTTPFLEHALRLYEKCGFVPAGVDELFGTPLITMTRKLR